MACVERKLDGRAEAPPYEKSRQFDENGRLLVLWIDYRG